VIKRGDTGLIGAQIPQLGGAIVGTREPQLARITRGATSANVVSVTGGGDQQLLSANIPETHSAVVAHRNDIATLRTGAKARDADGASVATHLTQQSSSFNLIRKRE
jgi:hypothetical protein